MKGDAAAKPKGTVFVRTEVCKGCSYCIDFCPSHALEFSREFNPKGYHYPVLAKPEACTGCDRRSSRRRVSTNRPWPGRERLG